jgi:hypothetical protein
MLSLASDIVQNPAFAQDELDGGEPDAVIARREL